MRMVTSVIENFNLINSLLVEHERKDATYKFALIRGSIEIFQKYDHQKKENCEKWITFPLGLMIERWFMYYYPIFESEFFIPQIGQDKDNIDGTTSKLQFRKAFDPIIEYYRKRGRFSKVFSDYQKGCIPLGIQEKFLDMCLQIRDTTVDNPMKHLGFSITKEKRSNLSC